MKLILQQPHIGGLVGQNTGGAITNSYAAGTVTGALVTGGLVGQNEQGSHITNSYAIGNVAGNRYVSGLVAENTSQITNSYATGAVSGNADVGGLVGVGFEDSVTHSYWDRQASDIAVSAGGTSKTTAELQLPTTATGIYSNWSTADWNFGDPSNYPFLKYAVGPDSSDPACGVSERPACGILLSHQLPSLLAELAVANGTVFPPFDPERMNYDATVAFDTTQLELQTTATGASLRIHSDVSAIEVLRTDTASAMIPLNLIDEELIRIEVMAEARRRTVYSLSVSYATDDDTAKPSIPILVVDGAKVVDEDATVTLRVGNEYQCGADIRCEWHYRDDAFQAVELADAELSGGLLQLSFTVPTNYAGMQTTRQLIIVFAARNRGGLVRVETPFVIMQRDNGSIDAATLAPLTLSDHILSAPELNLVDDPDGVNAHPAIRYQWQRAKGDAVDLLEPTSWENIDDATATTYTLAGTQFSPHRVQIRYTDAQGYETMLYSQWIRDIDADDDGLIEIRYIEELDAMRHQLDGSAYRESVGAEKFVAGCAAGGCTGYELTRDLDFMSDASYATPSNRVRWTVADYESSEELGWEPIGTESEPFNTIFEGNGHTLSNLMINRPTADQVGLFGSAGSDAVFVNLGLLNNHIKGNGSVGGLVGANSAGRIINSYAVGTVTGMDDEVGGLVGRNEEGRITNSYAIAAVIGERGNVGGLVGANNRGHIANSYATGTVTGMSNEVGGLVGRNTGHITNSYATGTVSGDANVGGLIGFDFGGNITHSYWDRQTSGVAISDGGTSKVTAELQSPTAATGIYRDWSTANWDFGGPSHYPLLKYAIGSDSSNPACSVSEQPACGTLLPYQLPSLLTELLVVNGTLSPSFKPEIMSYDVTVDFSITQIKLQTTATGALLRIHSDVSDIEVLSDTTASVVIPLNLINDELIRIEVIEAAHRSTEYSLSVSYAGDSSTPRPSTPIVVVVDGIRAIDEGATVALRVANEYQCDIDLRCEWGYFDGALQAIELADVKLSTDSQQISFTVLADYTETQTTRQLIIVFTARNRSGLVSTEIPFVIMRQNDGSIDAATIAPPTLRANILSVPELDLADDPDGVNANPAIHYQWQRAQGSAAGLRDPTHWENIEGATGKIYVVSRDTQALPHRVRIRYTDGQGYENTVYSQWIRDIDTDDDGLIEIRYIEAVDAMRYQLDGSAYRASTATEKITTGCADGGCNGYELARDLDFMSDASYATSSNRVRWMAGDYADSEGRNWQPIGTEDEPFNTVFEGNGHTLFNLMINRPATDHVGLFGFAGSSATFVNLALFGVHIEGNDYVGSLIAFNNEASITNSYAMGMIKGNAAVGGLVGANRGGITNSYAEGTIEGNADVGGLVGVNINTTITNSYATGAVARMGNVGGLIGTNEGSIINSYATGVVSGIGNRGGLVAQNLGGTITHSYWDRQTSGIEISAGGVSKTTDELQSTIAATGIYQEWSTADWDFGDPLRYPFLKYAVGADPSNPACGISEQPTCGTLLPYQLPSLLAEFLVVNGTLLPSFVPERMNYDATVDLDVEYLELQTTASGASLRIYSDASDTEVRGTDTASAMVRLRAGGDTMVYIEVVKSKQRTEVYRLTVSYADDSSVPKPSTPTVVVVDGIRAIDESATVALRVSNGYQCSADLRCGWESRDAASQAIELADAKSSTDSLQFRFTAPTDYTGTQTTRQLIIVFAVRNRGGLVSAETSFVIMKQNNGTANAETIGPPTLDGDTLIVPEIDTADLATDPDGVNAVPALRYQWQRMVARNIWGDISDATGTTYRVGDTQASAYRVQISYTDGQDYDNTIYSMPIEVRRGETDLKVRLRVFLEAPL